MYVSKIPAFAFVMSLFSLQGTSKRSAKISCRRLRLEIADKKMLLLLQNCISGACWGRLLYIWIWFVCVSGVLNVSTL